MILNIIMGSGYIFFALGLTYCLINKNARKLQNLSIFGLGLMMIAGLYSGLPDGKTFSYITQLSISEEKHLIGSMIIFMVFPLMLVIVSTISKIVKDVSGDN